ncbi:hypothetical protein QR685DRAFT_475623 [Neurospora intermedia]|uniref:Questionable protein n=1 Tax=Neurospora intermedia TaxID=5142 RepID=A0ABR3DEN4_NEUIN
MRAAPVNASTPVRSAVPDVHHHTTTTTTLRSYLSGSPTVFTSEHGLALQLRHRPIPAFMRREQVTGSACRHGRFKPSSGQHHYYDSPARIRRNIACIRRVTYSTRRPKGCRCRPTPISYISAVKFPDGISISSIFTGDGKMRTSMSS